MKPLAVADAGTMCLALQDEIHRSDESRYDHRLHGVLLVAQGMSCPEVGRLLGDSARSVQYWVHQFEAEGFAGLAEGERPGRPSRFSEEQLAEISAALREPPSSVGLAVNLWDGKTLAQFIGQRWEIDLGVRQCQRLFRQLGFRLRKPRPLIARADPERQSAHKKTPQVGPKGRR
jgi:transposase